MTVDMTYNGSCAIILSDGDEVQQKIMAAMAERAAKGQTVKLTMDRARLFVSL